MKLKRDVLKLKRILAGLSQEGLAEKSGVTRQAISGFELGKRTPHPRTLKKIADALGCEMSVFVDLRG